MVAINFLKQFAPAVEAGTKKQTIRNWRKRKLPAIGDGLQLYTGMCTKSCRLLGTAFCTGVSGIRVIPQFGEVNIRPPGDSHWLIFDSERSLTKIAVQDGFATVDEFFQYFYNDVDEKGVFEGALINWGDLK